VDYYSTVTTIWHILMLIGLIGAYSLLGYIIRLYITSKKTEYIPSILITLVIPIELTSLTLRELGIISADFSLRIIFTGLILFLMGIYTYYRRLKRKRNS